MFWACLLFAAGTATLPQADARPAGSSAADPLVPDSVLALPGGPTLAVERASGLAVAGIRISAPLDPVWSSAVRVLIELALERTRAQAEAIGASLWGGIEGGRMAYQVVGDARDMDELAWIARRLAALPPNESVTAALAREEARLDRMAETPQGRLALELRRRSGSGRDRRRPVVTAGDIREVWRHFHARDRLRVFVLGDVPMPWILADLSRVGAPPRDGSRTGRAGQAFELSGPAYRPAPASGTPLSAWSAAAFRLGPAGDAAVMAATEALRVGLREVAAAHGALLRLHEEPGDAAGWMGITARASRRAESDAALRAALALMTEGSLDQRWRQGATEVRRKLADAVATPESWLSLADRTFASDPGDSSGWVRGALNQLASLRREDFAPVLLEFQASLFFPQIDG